MHECIYCHYRNTQPIVQCDDCDGWAHFKCAGVDKTIKLRPWSCVMCQEVFESTVIQMYESYSLVL